MVTKKELKECLLETSKEEIIEQFLDTISKLDNLEKNYVKLEQKYFKEIAKNCSLKEKLEKLGDK